MSGRGSTQCSGSQRAGMWTTVLRLVGVVAGAGAAVSVGQVSEMKFLEAASSCAKLHFHASEQYIQKCYLLCSLGGHTVLSSLYQLFLCAPCTQF